MNAVMRWKAAGNNFNKTPDELEMEYQQAKEEGAVRRALECVLSRAIFSVAFDQLQFTKGRAGTRLRPCDGALPGFTPALAQTATVAIARFVDVLWQTRRAGNSTASIAIDILSLLQSAAPLHPGSGSGDSNPGASAAESEVTADIQSAAAGGGSATTGDGDEDEDGMRGEAPLMDVIVNKLSSLGVQLAKAEVNMVAASTDLLAARASIVAAISGSAALEVPEASRRAREASVALDAFNGIMQDMRDRVTNVFAKFRSSFDAIMLDPMMSADDTPSTTGLPGDLDDDHAVEESEDDEVGKEWDHGMVGVPNRSKSKSRGLAQDLSAAPAAAASERERPGQQLPVLL
jgi:hypothetical protein